MSDDWLAPIERRFHVQRTHVSDPLVTALVSRIRRADLQPGDQINTAEIAHDYGVGRSSVREALFRLQRVGVIVDEPGAGARVADVTPDLVSWVSEEAARNLAFAAERGVPALDSVGRRRARELAASISDRLGWRETVSGPALELGQLFADAHGNPLLSARLRELSPAIACLVSTAKRRPDIALDDLFVRLDAAIDARDGQAVAAAMRRLYEI